MTRHKHFLCLVFSSILVSGFWFLSMTDTEWHYHPPTTEQMMLAKHHHPNNQQQPDDTSQNNVVVSPDDNPHVIPVKNGNSYSQDDDSPSSSSSSNDPQENEKPAMMDKDEMLPPSPPVASFSPQDERPWYDFVCDTAPNHAQPLQPLLMIANARTGSNLFFSFLERLAAHHHPSFDLLPLYEVFGQDDAVLATVLMRILHQIWQACQWEQPEEDWWRHQHHSLVSPKQVFAAAFAWMNTTSIVFPQQQQQQQQVLSELQHVLEQRFTDPKAFLQFLHRIPSTSSSSSSSHSFVALKVFSYHVQDLLQMTISEFIALISHTMSDKTQFVVLWRRNWLEMFVSFHIALQRNAWVQAASTGEDAIHVEKSELEWFVQQRTDFYQQVRDSFESQSIPYHVFEYDRDLSNVTQQMETVQRIQTQILRQTTATEDLVRTVVDRPGTAKQATVPLSEQIVNWEEVKSWGYSDVSLDWPDLFANHHLVV